MVMAVFAKLFSASGHVGFHLRVLGEGEVGAGDVFDRVQSDPERMTVREMSHLLFFDPENLEEAKRARVSGRFSPDEVCRSKNDRSRPASSTDATP